MIAWDKKYSTGIGVIDEQHQELFKMANELADSIKNNTEIDRPYLIARLEVYSLYHFTSEEHLMLRSVDIAKWIDILASIKNSGGKFSS